MVSSRSDLKDSLIDATDGVLDILRSDSFSQIDKFDLNFGLFEGAMSGVKTDFDRIKSVFDNASVFDIDSQLGNADVTTELIPFGSFYVELSKDCRQFVIMDFYFWCSHSGRDMSQNVLDSFVDYLNCSDLKKSHDELKKEYVYHEQPEWFVKNRSRVFMDICVDENYDFVNVDYSNTSSEALTEPLNIEFNTKVLKQFVMNNYHRKQNCNKK